MISKKKQNNFKLERKANFDTVFFAQKYLPTIKMSSGMKDKAMKSVDMARTRHAKVIPNKDLKEKFTFAQKVYKMYANLGRNWLYEHYGNGLKRRLPTLQSMRYYLVQYMVKYARKRIVAKIGYLPEFNRQSIDKLYEKLIINFSEYHKKQRSLYYQGQKEIGKYEKKHHCKYTGCGRIKYIHDDQYFNCISFKSNGRDSNGRQKGVYYIDEHHLHLPFFGTIYLKDSIEYYKDKKIAEVNLKQYKNGVFEVQIGINGKNIKKFTRKQLNKILDYLLSTDWNSADRHAFAHQDGSFDPVPKELQKKINKLQKKIAICDKYLFKDDHLADDSQKTKEYLALRAKCFEKETNLMTEWYKQVINGWVKAYPIATIEQLNSFTMRIPHKKKDKDKWLRKNWNKKLSKRMPGTFAKWCIDLYQNAGGIVLQVDSKDTSKRCFWCHTVNHDLKPGTEYWHCPNPDCPFHKDHWLSRDINAAINILEFALNPVTHPKWIEHIESIAEHEKDPDKKIKWKYLQEPEDLVNVF